MRPFAFLVFLLFVGCSTPRPANNPPPAAPPDISGLVTSHGIKDQKVLGAASEIDEIAAREAPSAAQPIRTQTDVIREAVKTAPADAIDLYYRKLAPVFDQLNAQLASLTAQNQSLKAQIEALQNAEQKKQVATVRWFGLGMIALGAVVAFGARMTPLGATLAGIGFSALGLAQLLSKPWFGVTLQVFAVLAIAGLVWAAVHAYRKGDLTSKALKEKDRLAGTLKTLVPVLDSAYEELDAAGKALLDRYIFDRLSSDAGSGMTPDQKAKIHEIRAGV